jgi:hypothetical protein
MAGAGKSTFSRALSAEIGVPVIHLDIHFWQPGWTEPSEDEWREIQRDLLTADEWIIDGNYHATLDSDLSVPRRSCSWTRHGGSVRAERLSAGFADVPMASSCPTVATSLRCDDCAKNGRWSGASGNTADPSAN